MFWSNLKMLLGFMPSVRFAECMQCHVCSSPTLRQCPNCKAAFPQNYVIRKWTALDIPEDRVPEFVTCPGCGRSLKPETEKCPECAATISREYASESIMENVKIGQAYVNAEKIETANPIITLVLYVVISGFAYFFDLPHVGWFLLIPIAMSIEMLLKIRQWFRWFGSHESDHADFVTARHKVNHARRRWLAVLAAQVSVAVLLVGWVVLRKLT